MVNETGGNSGDENIRDKDAQNDGGSEGLANEGKRDTQHTSNDNPKHLDIGDKSDVDEDPFNKLRKKTKPVVPEKLEPVGQDDTDDDANGSEDDGSKQSDSAESSDANSTDSKSTDDTNTDGSSDANRSSGDTTKQSKQSDSTSDASSKKKRRSTGVESGKVKKGRKISPKLFLLGCGVFFLIFLIIAALGLYYIANSSQFLQGIGLEIDDVKNILLIFAALFFGVVFFAGFYVFVLNIYRLVTTKKQSKLRYVMGLFGGVMVILITIITGTLSIRQIQSLGGAQAVNTNSILVPYLETKSDRINVADVNLPAPVPLIAPFTMQFQLNKQQFDRNIVPQLGNRIITGFEMECGNGQVLEGGQRIYQSGQGGFFEDHCLFLEKGTYTLTLHVRSTATNGGDARTDSFENIASVQVNAEIQLSPSEGEARLNDQMNELILGVAPLQVDFEGSLVFSDLQLQNNAILWDMTDDNQADIENNANFIYPFGDAKLHTINYQLPEHPFYSEYWFTFDLRVLESNLSQCSLSTQSIDQQEKRWRFVPEFDDLVDVVEYQYTIYDKRRDTFIERNTSVTDERYTYRFNEGGEYEIQVSYFTPEGDKGNCAVEDIQVGIQGNQVEFDLKYKQNDDDPFLDAGEGTQVSLDSVNNEIFVGLVPAILQLDITQINPDPNSEVKLYYNGRQIFGNREGDLFEVNIGTLGEKELQFEITSTTGQVDEQLYTIDVKREPIQARMNVSPSVGESPLTVELDASVSGLFDEDDEIVFFTWDFGNGEIQQNLSAGKVSHTYQYDIENENGEYYPRVTITTRKGRTDTYKLESPIVVKRQQREVEISSETHPSGAARVGDIVEFTVETDGRVERIDRDFGNDMGGVGCDGRTCVTTPVRFQEAGDYTVRVEVQYENDVPVTSRMRFRIVDNN